MPKPSRLPKLSSLILSSYSEQPPSSLPLPTPAVSLLPNHSHPSLQFRLHVKPTPRLGPSRVHSIDPKLGRINLVIAEPPVDGKANDALKELVSRLFGPGVGKNNVRIVRGERGREKVVIVDMSGVEKSAAEEGLVEMAWRRVRGACGGGEGLVEMERRRDRSWWGREG